MKRTAITREQWENIKNAIREWNAAESNPWDDEEDYASPYPDYAMCCYLGDEDCAQDEEDWNAATYAAVYIALWSCETSSEKTKRAKVLENVLNQAEIDTENAEPSEPFTDCEGREYRGFYFDIIKQQEKDAPKA